MLDTEREKMMTPEQINDHVIAQFSFILEELAEQLEDFQGSLLEISEEREKDVLYAFYTAQIVGALLMMERIGFVVHNKLPLTVSSHMWKFFGRICTLVSEDFQEIEVDPESSVFRYIKDLHTACTLRSDGFSEEQIGKFC